MAARTRHQVSLSLYALHRIELGLRLFAMHMYCVMLRVHVVLRKPGAHMLRGHHETQVTDSLMMDTEREGLAISWLRIIILWIVGDTSHFFLQIVNDVNRLLLTVTICHDVCCRLSTACVTHHRTCRASAAVRHPFRRLSSPAAPKR